MARKTETCIDCGGKGYYSKPGDRCTTCKGLGYIIIKEDGGGAGGGFFMAVIKLAIFLVAAYFAWEYFLKDIVMK